jgi:hypothetical protein
MTQYGTIHRSVSTVGNDVSFIITDFTNGARQIIVDYDPKKPGVIKVNNRIIKIEGGI